MFVLRRWMGHIQMMLPLCFLQVIFGLTSVFWDSIFQGYVEKFQAWVLIRGHNMFKYVSCLTFAIFKGAKRNFKAACCQIYSSFSFVGFSIVISDLKKDFPHSKILVRAQICYLPLFNSSAFPNLMWKHGMKWKAKLIFFVVQRY